jgi:putative DNA primase/helicase
MNNQGPIGSEQRYTIYTDEPKTNGAGRTETMQLSAQEELIAGLITDSALSSVVAETGLNDSHFKRGTGLPGAFRFAMEGPQSVKQALDGGPGTTYAKVQHLAHLRIHLSEDRAKALAQQVVRSIKPEKDLREEVQEGLKEAKDAGKEPTLEGDKRLFNGRRLVMVNAASIKPEGTEWLWKGRLARGEHTTIAGDPGSGKSQLSISIIAAVTTGGPWPCAEGRAPLGNVIILSAEDNIPKTLIPRLMAAGADLNRIDIVKATYLEDSKGTRTFNIQADFDLLEKTIISIGDVALVSIDPITAYMGSGFDSYKNVEVRRVLQPVGELAERSNVAFLTVTHFTKGNANTNTKALYRVMGSVAFTAAPRIGFMVTEDPENPDRRLLLHLKNNLAKPPQGLAYRLVQAQIDERQDIIASSVVWEGEPVSTTADQALGGGNNNEPTAKTDAIEFLTTALAKGAMGVADLELEARAAGLLKEDQPISQCKAFRSARKALAIKPYQPKGQKAGGWIWSLPGHQMPSKVSDAS